MKEYNVIYKHFMEPNRELWMCVSGVDESHAYDNARFEISGMYDIISVEEVEEETA